MKFSRTRLARGSKLIVDHVFKPIYDFGVGLGVGLGPENRPSDKATFRVTIHTGQISGAQQFFYIGAYPDAEGARPFCYPFVIPQPQELLSFRGVGGSNSVRISLEEVSISLDQNGENAIMVGTMSTLDEGQLDHNRVPATKIDVSIVEKNAIPFSFGSMLHPERTVFSTTMLASALAGRDRRNNPFVLGGISAPLTLYSTYALVIDAEFLRLPDAPAAGDGHYSTLPSFMVSMVFSCDFVARDASTEIQNLPTAHIGVTTLSPVIVTKPVGGDVISASDVVNGFGMVESRLRRRLWSGYSRQSDTPLVESFLKDSGLEVIAVPLWQNFGAYGRLTGKTVVDVPNKMLNTSDPTVDERIIQIGYPFTVHHVILVNNYASGSSGDDISLALNAGKPPSSATFMGEVGVALLTGLHGDHMAYQQLAHLSYTVASLPGFVVDRFSPMQRQKLVIGDYTHELIQVPLMDDGAGAGAGMTNVLGAQITQGAPFFVGRGAGGRTEKRQEVGDNLSGTNPPNTVGAEMFIVVRQSFKDSNGLDAVTNSAVDNNTVYAGVGGNMLYIIGKKTMVGGGDPNILGAV